MKPVINNMIVIIFIGIYEIFNGTPWQNPLGSLTKMS